MGAAAMAGEGCAARTVVAGMASAVLLPGPDELETIGAATEATGDAAGAAAWAAAAPASETGVAGVLALGSASTALARSVCGVSALVAAGGETDSAPPRGSEMPRRSMKWLATPTRRPAASPAPISHHVAERVRADANSESRTA